MWNICEVLEGDCKGKFVILSFLGLPVNDGENVLFFDSVEDANAHLDGIENRLFDTVSALGD